MKYVELKKHIASGALSAAYILYGNDRYLLSYAKKLFTDGVDLPELNVNTFAGDARPSEVVKACSIMPLMARYRVVYYYGFKTVDRAITDYLNDPSPDTVLLLEPAAYNDKDGLGALATPIDCSHLEEEVLLAWIARSSGRRFSTDAAKLLISYTLGDLARIETEVKKLCMYTDGLVEAELVRSMVTRDAEHKIFELSQEVFSGDPDKAYAIMANLLKELDPLAILKTLYGEAHKLLYVTVSRDADSEIAASFKVKPYALKYLRQRAKLFTPVRIKAIVDYIADCDYRIKAGSMTSDVAVYNVVARILSLRNKGRV